MHNYNKLKSEPREANFHFQNAFFYTLAAEKIIGAM